MIFDELELGRESHQDLTNLICD